MAERTVGEGRLRRRSMNVFFTAGVTSEDRGTFVTTKYSQRVVSSCLLLSQAAVSVSALVFVAALFFFCLFWLFEEDMKSTQD